MKMVTILENEFVILIPLQISHFDNLFKIASDPLIWEQHPSKDRYKENIFKLYFDSGIENGNTFLIIDKFNNQPIGSTRYYNIDPINSSIAIGYTFLDRAYWGGKFNFSSKQLLINYAFQYFDKIYFHIGKFNIRSQKAVIKLGATQTKELDFEINNELIPHIEYILLKSNSKL